MSQLNISDMSMRSEAETTPKNRLNQAMLLTEFAQLRPKKCRHRFPAGEP